ncbi:MAG: MFS transporter [Armatimonadota bacterium]|nr:MFS transporter [Armatimonadota bacterium]MDR7475532.1 MFS transporter [Armatimonadota bacterium]MDR7539216.1 MFS transporter [Armatimonadota bacterium]
MRAETLRAAVGRALVLGRLRYVDRWLTAQPGTIRANARTDFISAALFGAFGGLTIPFIPVMGRRLGASPLEVSLLVAASALAMLLSLLWVRLLRAADPVRLVVWTQSVGRGLFLLMPFVRTPGLYLALVLLYHGVASAAALGYAEVMGAVYPQDLRARIMAMVRTGMAAAWIGAALLGGRIMQAVPFQVVFAGAAAFGVAGAQAFGRMRLPLRRETLERPAAGAAWRALRQDWRFRRFLGAFFVFGFGAWLMGPAVPLLLVDVLHASNFQVGLLGAVTSGAWLVAYYRWGRVIDQRSAPGALVLVFLVGTLTPLVYLLATSPWVVMLAGASDGVVSAGVDLGWLTALLSFAPAGQVVHYVAIFNTLVGVRGSTAPLLAGLLIPRLGVRAIFALAAACTLSGALLMRRAAREGAQPGPSR